MPATFILSNLFHSIRSTRTFPCPALKLWWALQSAHKDRTRKALNSKRGDGDVGVRREVFGRSRITGRPFLIRKANSHTPGVVWGSKRCRWQSRKSTNTTRITYIWQLSRASRSLRENTRTVFAVRCLPKRAQSSSSSSVLGFSYRHALYALPGNPSRSLGMWLWAFGVVNLITRKQCVWVCVLLMVTLGP